MNTVVIAFLAGFVTLVVCFLLALVITRTAKPHPRVPAVKIPNGHTHDRAVRLEIESERYRNYLVDRLLQRSEEQRRRQ